jgi:hypothetical protein
MIEHNYIKQIFLPLLEGGSKIKNTNETNEILFSFK